MKISKDRVDEKLIGEVLYEGSKRYKMKQTLLNAKFELIEVDGPPTSLISLPNGNLVCSTTGLVKLLDENLKEMKSFSTGGLSFLALNCRNEIYVSVNNKHFIILFDLNLNKLKQFGSKGAGNNKFKYPRGLCCHGDYLYICDHNNSRIQILTLDFEYVNSIELDGLGPFRVQTSETTIGVSCGNATFFFDLKSRGLKFKLNNYGTSNINYINSIFYGTNYEEKKFYFFDSNGNFIEEEVINENWLGEHITHWLGGFCRHNDILYFADYSLSQILKFTE